MTQDRHPRLRTRHRPRRCCERGGWSARVRFDLDVVNPQASPMSKTTSLSAGLFLFPLSCNCHPLAIESQRSTEWSETVLIQLDFSPLILIINQDVAGTRFAVRIRRRVRPDHMQPA